MLLQGLKCEWCGSIRSAFTTSTFKPFSFSRSLTCYYRLYIGKIGKIFKPEPKNLQAVVHGVDRDHFKISQQKMEYLLFHSLSHRELRDIYFPKKKHNQILISMLSKPFYAHRWEYRLAERKKGRISSNPIV